MEPFVNRNDFVRFSGIKQNRPALHLRGIAKRKIFLFSSLFVSSLLYAGDNPFLFVWCLLGLSSFGLFCLINSFQGVI